MNPSKPLNPLNPLNPEPPESDLPDALRWQLRALRQPQAPERDLWPGIAAQLASTPQLSAREPARRNWRMPASLAAGVLVAWGVFTLVRPESSQPSMPVARSTLTSTSASTSTAPTLVQIEAAGLTRQYQAAVAEVALAPVSPALAQTIEELDRSAAMILDALQRDPDSRLLLDQLRRTYTHRLALAQRMT